MKSSVGGVCAGGFFPVCFLGAYHFTCKYVLLTVDCLDLAMHLTVQDYMEFPPFK